ARPQSAAARTDSGAWVPDPVPARWMASSAHSRPAGGAGPRGSSRARHGSSPYPVDPALRVPGRTPPDAAWRLVPTRRRHAPPPRYRRPARLRLRPADPLPLRDAVRRRVGLPPEKRLPGRMAAVADDRAQPLAHAAAVHGVRHRARVGADRGPAPVVRAVAQPPADGAAAVRDVRGGGLPGLLRGPGQRAAGAGPV